MRRPIRISLFLLLMRQVMDMTTALDYSEDYSDPKADIYIDLTAEMDIVRFASFPTAKNAQIDSTSLRSIAAGELGRSVGWFC